MNNNELKLLTEARRRLFKVIFYLEHYPEFAIVEDVAKELHNIDDLLDMYT